MNTYKTSWQETLVFTGDIGIVAFCYVAAYLIRFDGVPDKEHLAIMVKIFPLVLAVRIAALIYFKVHRGIWQYASIKDLTQILKAASVSSIFVVAVVMGLNIGHPRSIFIIDWLLLTIVLSGTRFIIRISRPLRWKEKNADSPGKKVLIVGAGDAGEMIVREMIYRYRHNYEVVGLIDDDPKKYKKHIHGVTVIGTSGDIPEIIRKRKIAEIIIAVPSATSEQMHEIVNYCIESGAKYRTLPNLSNIVDGTVKVKELREVRLEDLLGRDEVFLDREKIKGYIQGKNVLISGAGGSIGSELCRQVAALMPRELVLFEKSENSLFYIDMELEQFFSGVKKVPVIGDICDRKRVRQVFTQYCPEIIFHAAAHKHVPLMEMNSMEAIKNNVFGTEVLAEDAVRFAVEKFIMLSTDKTVEPTSLMGVSKKIAEMYVAAMQKKKKTQFMSVRFGNVLGSEGSVIPTFKKQIEKGGPVTITHPEIKRYFMTIPEAAGLVLKAGLLGHGGEIFVLEMGRQIKIVDMACDLIRLSGLKPNEDIKIRFTGLRPGEKMYESLVEAGEKLIKTNNEKIFVIEQSRDNKPEIFEHIKALRELVAREEEMEVLIAKLKQIVPGYKPNAHMLSIGQKERKVKEIDILVVDDDKIVQSLLQKFLEGKGYNVLLAANGREALEIVKNNLLRLAIVDITLPGFMDGIKLLKYIKKINSAIEVILITGSGTAKTRRLSRSLGAYAYLEKPFDLTSLKAHIERALTEQNRQTCRPQRKIALPA
ncbi:MAG: polysaccharide biosynthesis protein [Candidatus Omnitrophota bacterium]